MNFIKDFLKTGVKQAVIELKFDENGFGTVFVTVKSTVEDSAIKDLKPFFLTGKAEEIDDIFFEKLQKPLQSTQSLIDNVQQAEAHRAEQAKKTQAEKQRKDEIKKAEEALKKIVSSDKYKPIEDKKRVLRAIEAIKELDTENTYANKIKGELTKDLQTENSLFNS